MNNLEYWLDGRQKSNKSFSWCAKYNNLVCIRVFLYETQDKTLLQTFKTFSCVCTVAPNEFSKITYMSRYIRQVWRLHGKVQTMWVHIRKIHLFWTPFVKSMLMLIVDLQSLALKSPFLDMYDFLNVTSLTWNPLSFAPRSFGVHISIIFTIFWIPVKSVSCKASIRLHIWSFLTTTHGKLTILNRISVCCHRSHTVAI